MSYSPTIGRFTQEDPEVYVDGMNPYQFVLSNPLLYTDPTGTEHVGPTSSPMLPQFPIPPGSTIVEIEPGSEGDRLATSLASFLFVDGADSVYIYPAGSNVSKRFWNHHEFFTGFRDWLEGAKSFCDCKNPERTKGRTYWSGLQQIQYTAPFSDFLRDVGVNTILSPQHEGAPYGDTHIQQVGSFTFRYQAWIDCDANDIGFRGVLYNSWSVESLTRLPFGSRTPLVTGGRRVHQKVYFEFTQPIHN